MHFDRKSPPVRSWRRRQLTRLWSRVVRWFKVVVIIILFVFTIFFDDIIHEIPSGYRAVLWSRFDGGTELQRSYGEGIFVTWPWDKVHAYDTREQSREHQTIVYAQDGLEITVNVSVRFRLSLPNLPSLHQEIGPDYISKVIVPETISTLRKVIGNYTPEMIYSQDELGLLDELHRTIKADLDDRFFTLIEILVLDLRLPTAIHDAIKLKLTEEQQMLSYRFRLEREEDEKIRRITEAEGIQEFEAISGIPILKWRGLEVTEKFATSPNAKIVLMGSGERDLPLLLSADVTMPAPAPAPAPVPPEKEAL